MARVERRMTVSHEAGLHARPAALFVEMANRFRAQVTLTYDGRQANAKSILGVLKLGAVKGAEIVVVAEGDDAQAAVQALEQLVQSNFEPAGTREG